MVEGGALASLHFSHFIPTKVEKAKICMKNRMLAALFGSAILLATASQPSMANGSTHPQMTGVSIPDTSGFSGVPGVPDGGPDLNRSRFTYQIDPSQHVQDYFYISNVGTVPLDLIVYGADGTTTKNGSFDVAESTYKSTDVGSWVTFGNGKASLPIHLKPNQNASLPFLMQVPSNASPGDHAGGIAVATAPQGDGQIRVERRVVTRLYARVRGTLAPRLTVGNVHAFYTPTFNPLDGVVTETFSIVNSGNVSLKAVAFANVSGFLGIPLGNQNVAPVTEILPGTSRDYTITISGVGQWVFLNPQVKLVPDVDKDALNPGALVTITRDTTLWEFPTTWFIILFIAFVIVFVVRRQVAKRRRQVSQWLEYTESEARRKAASN